MQINGKQSWQCNFTGQHRREELRAKLFPAKESNKGGLKIHKHTNECERKSERKGKKDERKIVEILK